ncbi:MAG: efflux RND transporter periplasmic adaptor subunit [Pseudomonadota bacterium]
MTDAPRMLTRWLLTALVAAGLAACQSGAGEDPQNADAEEENAPIPVEVAGVTRGDVQAVYSGTASLETDGEAVVLARVGGEITSLLVEEGDQVKAGQVLARVDQEQLKLELARARANLRRLEQEYNRNVELHAKSLLSSIAFENSKFELEALKADLALSELQLSYTDIRAPIAGVVAIRHVKLGNTIAVSAPVFTITEMQPLLAYLYVPERDFNKIQTGQIADVQVDALPDSRFVGAIARISPVIDADSGTFKVTVEVDDTTGRLKPGMFGRISVVYDVHTDSLLIPRAAIVDDQTDKAVFVVSNGTVERRPVETGYAAGANVEVVSGLTGSERVVVIGQGGLKDGGRVEVVSADGVPEPSNEDDDDRAALAAKSPQAG